MRLFTALLPSEDVTRGLVRAQDALRPFMSVGRMTPAESLHLTVVFLGEADSAAVVPALETVESPPVLLTIDRLGSFRGRRGRTVWAGVRLTPELEALHGACAAALGAAGLAVEERPYRAHITLARDAAFRAGFSLESDENRSAPLTCGADRLSLMRSDFTDRGVRYTEIYSRPLR